MVYGVSPSISTWTTRAREWVVSTAHNLPDMDLVEARVRHFIFSSRPNSSELTGGKIKMTIAYSKPRNLLP
jgi:hypothetical protein